MTTEISLVLDNEIVLLLKNIIDNALDNNFPEILNDLVKGVVVRARVVNLALAGLEFDILICRDFSEAYLACKVASHEVFTEIELLKIPSHFIVHETSHILCQSFAAYAQN